MVFACLLIRQLIPEWRLNPQYRYGFLVPVLLGLLLWRTREQLPVVSAREGRGIGVCVLLVVFGLMVTDVVATSNPDWRLALWVYALLVFCGVVLLLEWVGGWGRWFAGALGLLFFAIPWPTMLEQWAVQGLMRVVAGVTGEFCNLIGIPVESRGNVLRLNSGEWVGVEDACSGVRSLQSSLMAAYFFGRWMCLGWGRSIFLFAMAAAMSFLFNLVRAIALTLLAHSEGAAAVGRWHDFAGNSVALLVFLALMLVAIKLEQVPSRPGRERVRGQHVALPVVVLGLLMCVPLVSCWWFAGRGRGDGGVDGVAVNWAALPAGVRSEPIADRSRSLLRYTEGEHGWWKGGAGTRFDLYEFRWDGGLISSFGEIHRPDVCLPAAGLLALAHDPTWRRLLVKGQSLVVERFAFGENNSRVYVFFCAWDTERSGGEVAMVTGLADRLENAWKGRRVEGRRVIQLLVTGAGPNRADAEADRLLRRILR